MSKLLTYSHHAAPAFAADSFTAVADDAALPQGPVLVSLARFRNEREALLARNTALGIRLQSSENPETLGDDVQHFALIALEFPKFRDGRAFSWARILRTRLGFKGEIRAVGDVLREQAQFMLRCGFDAFEPADGSTLDEWERASHRFRHAYQRSLDGRAPAFAEREA